MSKAEDNPFPYLTLVETSAPPATPAAGRVRIYRDSDDNVLYQVDELGVATPIGGSSGGAVIPVVKTKRTAGNLTTGTSSAWTDLTTAHDLVIAAAAGDELEISLNFLTGTETVQTAFDVATRVAGATVNRIGGGLKSGGGGWATASGAFLPVSGYITYTVQAGDISGGNVTLRIQYWQSNTILKTVYANTDYPLHFSVKNLKH